MAVIPFDIGKVETKQAGPTRTYALDMERGRIIGMVDGKEAVNQFIKKALLTPRFKCLVYDNQYGSEIKAVVFQQSAEEDYLEAELPVAIKEALMVDERVLDVSDFVFGNGSGKDEVAVQFVVDTIYGKIPVREVI